MIVIIVLQYWLYDCTVITTVNYNRKTFIVQDINLILSTSPLLYRYPSVGPGPLSLCIESERNMILIKSESAESSKSSLSLKAALGPIL